MQGVHLNGSGGIQLEHMLGENLIRLSIVLNFKTVSIRRDTNRRQVQLAMFVVGGLESITSGVIFGQD